MLTAKPLVIRRSRGNFNYIFSTAFGAGLIAYACALYFRWPALSSFNVDKDNGLSGFLLVVGVFTLAVSSLKPLWDRRPLLRIDESGIAPSETGNIFVPWSEISDWRFEKLSEGRSAYWYFLFTQTDEATGLKFDYKISADEFDCDFAEVELSIDRYKAQDRKTVRRKKPRPETIVTGPEGDMLSVGYSRNKEWRAIGTYISIAAVTILLAAYLALNATFGSRWLELLLLDARGVIKELNVWQFAALAAIVATALLASAFRLRDLFLRNRALVVDRTGVHSPDLGGGTVAWESIGTIRFEPYGVMHLSVTEGPLLGERFINVERTSLSQQDIFAAVVWLVARYGPKLGRLDAGELPPPQFRG